MVVEDRVVGLHRRRIGIHLVSHQVDDLATDFGAHSYKAVLLRSDQDRVVASSAETLAICCELAYIPVFPCRPKIQCVLRIGQGVPLSHDHVEGVELVLIDPLDLHCRDVDVVRNLKSYYALLISFKE